MKLDFTLKKACPSEKGGLRSCNPVRGLLGRAARHSLVGRTTVLCSDFPTGSECRDLSSLSVSYWIKLASAARGGAEL